MSEQRIRRFEDTRGFKCGACIGSLVLIAAGAAWSLVPLLYRVGTPIWQFAALTIPTVMFAALGVSRLVMLARLSHLEPSEAERRESAQQGRKMGLGFAAVFTVEIILIAVVAIGLARANRPLLIPVVVMAIVGAHFVPLAKIFRIPTYLAMGIGLIGLAAGSLLIPDENTRVFTLGIASTLVLWASAAAVLAVHARMPSSDQPI